MNTFMDRVNAIVQQNQMPQNMMAAPQPEPSYPDAGMGALSSVVSGAPRQTMIGNQPHMLAYINPEEEALIQSQRGGIPAFEGPGGVPAYYSWDDFKSDIGIGSSTPSATTTSSNDDKPGFFDTISTGLSNIGNTISTGFSNTFGDQGYVEKFVDENIYDFDQDSNGTPVTITNNNNENQTAVDTVTTSPVNTSSDAIYIGAVSDTGQYAGDGFEWQVEPGTNALTRIYTGVNEGLTGSADTVTGFDNPNVQQTYVRPTAADINLDDFNFDAFAENPLTLDDTGKMLKHMIGLRTFDEADLAKYDFNKDGVVNQADVEAGSAKISSTGNFNRAFADARAEQGAGGTFIHNGQSYSTNYAEEENLDETNKLNLTGDGLGVLSTIIPDTGENTFGQNLMNVMSFLGDKTYVDGVEVGDERSLSEKLANPLTFFDGAWYDSTGKLVEIGTGKDLTGGGTAAGPFGDNYVYGVADDFSNNSVDTTGMTDDEILVEDARMQMLEDIPPSMTSYFASFLPGMVIPYFGGMLGEEMLMSGIEDRRAIFDQQIAALEGGATPIFNEAGEYTGYEGEAGTIDYTMDAADTTATDTDTGAETVINTSTDAETVTNDPVVNRIYNRFFISGSAAGLPAYMARWVNGIDFNETLEKVIIDGKVMYRNAEGALLSEEDLSNALKYDATEEDIT